MPQGFFLVNEEFYKPTKTANNNTMGITAHSTIDSLRLQLPIKQKDQNKRNKKQLQY